MTLPKIRTEGMVYVPISKTFASTAEVLQYVLNNNGSVGWHGIYSENDFTKELIFLSERGYISEKESLCCFDFSSVKLTGSSGAYKLYTYVPWYELLPKLTVVQDNYTSQEDDRQIACFFTRVRSGSENVEPTLGIAKAYHLTNTGAMVVVEAAYSDRQLVLEVSSLQPLTSDSSFVL